MNTLLHALSPLSSNEPQQPRNRFSFAPVEGSSPTAGPGTAGAGILSGDKLVIAQYRQAVYAHERLIEKLYDLMPERMDDAYDLVRAEYLAIHGPRD